MARRRTCTLSPWRKTSESSFLPTLSPFRRALVARLLRLAEAHAAITYLSVPAHLALLVYSILFSCLLVTE